MGIADQLQEATTAIELPKRVGDWVTFEAHGKKLKVKYHSRNTYFAKVEGETRGRWGNKAQIREDIKHFMEMSSLPRSKGTSWH